MPQACRSLAGEESSMTTTHPPPPTPDLTCGSPWSIHSTDTAVHRIPVLRSMRSTLQTGPTNQPTASRLADDQTKPNSPGGPVRAWPLALPCIADPRPILAVARSCDRSPLDPPCRKRLHNMIGVQQTTTTHPHRPVGTDEASKRRTRGGLLSGIQGSRRGGGRWLWEVPQ